MIQTSPLKYAKAGFNNITHANKTTNIQTNIDTHLRLRKCESMRVGKYTSVIVYNRENMQV